MAVLLVTLNTLVILDNNVKMGIDYQHCAPYRWWSEENALKIDGHDVATSPDRRN